MCQGICFCPFFICMDDDHLVLFVAEVFVLQVIHLLADHNGADDHNNGGDKLADDQSLPEQAGTVFRSQFSFQHFNRVETGKNNGGINTCDQCNDNDECNKI